ncbi:helix-turn-helix transcriptional regulator (plasmid) [Serratia sp. L9]|uniref:helix-turn-helix transcriptional regulator n=1 Tax=Serratia sp. L9 TaxID=3423946 RepID=UPI003D67B64E
MAAIETAQFARYFELFPEMTPTQAMTCILYSMGLTIPTIADLRGVSQETVRKVLQEARQKLELSNLCAVTSVVQVRLTMAMMGLHIDLQEERSRVA